MSQRSNQTYPLFQLNISTCKMSFVIPSMEMIFGIVHVVSQWIEYERDNVKTDFIACLEMNSFHFISSFTTKSTGSKTIRSFIQFYDLCIHSYSSSSLCRALCIERFGNVKSARTPIKYPMHVAHAIQSRIYTVAIDYGRLHRYVTLWLFGQSLQRMEKMRGNERDREKRRHSTQAFSFGWPQK